jgi:hypothetical protein
MIRDNKVRLRDGSQTIQSKGSGVGTCSGAKSVMTSGNRRSSILPRNKVRLAPLETPKAGNRTASPGVTRGSFRAQPCRSTSRETCR